MSENTRRDSVSIAFVNEGLAALRHNGIDIAPILATSNIPLILLSTPQARVSADSFGQLWRSIAATLDDEFFGLDARRMKAGSYVALCRQAIRCATLNEALRATLEWFNLILDESRLSLKREGRLATVEISDAPSARPLRQRNRVFAHETLLVMILGLACWLIDRRIPLQKTEFGYPRPARAAEYDAMFARGAKFDASKTRVAFAASALHAPVAQNSASLRRFLNHAPANFILRYRNDQSPASRIRHRLQDTPIDQWPSFTALAQEMGTAPSTLHRQLAREGAGFGAIRDALRRDRAIERLTSSRVPASRIAEELGFAEPGAFYRAFRKWTGVTPGAYRQEKD